MMNPQILLDAVEHGLKAAIVLFDNRRMAAISGLQQAQCGAEFRTSDGVAVDYVRMARAFPACSRFRAATRRSRSAPALETARSHGACR